MDGASGSAIKGVKFLPNVDFQARPPLSPNSARHTYENDDTDNISVDTNAMSVDSSITMSPRFHLHSDDI